MAGPTLRTIEENLVTRLREYEAGVAENNTERIWEARSSLASTMAYLLNLFLDEDAEMNWCGFGADDLLDAIYDFHSCDKMTAVGLMCWGDQDQCSFLSPFVGEFERDLEKSQLVDFTLLFSPTGPDEGPFSLRYTRDRTTRQQLLDGRPKSVQEWSHVYQRRQLLTPLE